MGVLDLLMQRIARRGQHIRPTVGRRQRATHTFHLFDAIHAAAVENAAHGIGNRFVVIVAFNQYRVERRDTAACAIAVLYI